jgi:hypothetical protein
MGGEGRWERTYGRCDLFCVAGRAKSIVRCSCQQRLHSFVWRLRLPDERGRGLLRLCNITVYCFTFSLRFYRCRCFQTRSTRRGLPLIVTFVLYNGSKHGLQGVTPLSNNHSNRRCPLTDSISKLNFGFNLSRYGTLFPNPHRAAPPAKTSKRARGLKRAVKTADKSSENIAKILQWLLVTLSALAAAIDRSNVAAASTEGGASPRFR